MNATIETTTNVHCTGCSNLKVRVVSRSLPRCGDYNELSIASVTFFASDEQLAQIRDAITSHLGDATSFPEPEHPLAQRRAWQAQSNRSERAFAEPVEFEGPDTCVTCGEPVEFAGECWECRTAPAID